jgi:hypothetical protein
VKRRRSDRRKQCLPIPDQRKGITMKKEAHVRPQEGERILTLNSEERKALWRR